MNRYKVLLFFMLIGLFCSSDSEFTESHPMLFKPLQQVPISTGSNILIHQATIQSPCAFLTNLSNDTELYANCLEKYRDLFQDPLHRICSTLSYKRAPKAAVGVVIAGITAVAAFAGLFTVMVQNQATVYNSVQQQQENIEEFRRIWKAIHKLEEVNDQIMLRMTFDRIWDRLGLAIKSFEDALRVDHPVPSIFLENIYAVGDVPNNTLYFQKCTVRQVERHMKDVLTIGFRSYNIDPDQTLFASAYIQTRMVNSSKCYYPYTGPKYFIINRASQTFAEYRQDIEVPLASHQPLEPENTLRFIPAANKSLNDYIGVECNSSAPVNPIEFVTHRKIGDNLFIYCYGFSISLNNSAAVKCPSFVFETPFTNFNITNGTQAVKIFNSKTAKTFANIDLASDFQWCKDLFVHTNLSERLAHLDERARLLENSGSSTISGFFSGVGNKISNVVSEHPWWSLLGSFSLTGCVAFILRWFDIPYKIFGCLMCGYEIKKFRDKRKETGAVQQSSGNNKRLPDLSSSNDDQNNSLSSSGCEAIFTKNPTTQQPNSIYPSLDSLNEDAAKIELKFPNAKRNVDSLEVDSLEVDSLEVAKAALPY